MDSSGWLAGWMAAVVVRAPVATNACDGGVLIQKLAVIYREVLLRRLPLTVPWLQLIRRGLMGSFRIDVILSALMSWYIKGER